MTRLSRHSSSCWTHFYFCPLICWCCWWLRRDANYETNSYCAVVFFVGSKANNALSFGDSLDRSPGAHISLCHPCVVDNHIVFSIEEFQSLAPRSVTTVITSELNSSNWNTLRYLETSPLWMMVNAVRRRHAMSVDELYAWQVTFSSVLLDLECFQGPVFNIWSFQVY